MENIQNKNIVYFCVDHLTMPYKGVRGKARVSIIEDVDFTVSLC